MFRVFNMGVGFCLVTSEADAERVIAIVQACGKNAYVIGHAVADRDKRIRIAPKNLVSQGKAFVKSG